ncbi:unnamed protein product [Adineta steineri]|uniref:Enoyl reductase (ER) domain-containing protein n=1 Tax=Adineta steineri TaxID=433720 RepID=A0A815ERB0_9BILA|nr:unnamed protein product [Adineta steineri]CAF1318842.1 unnamed protein product [Adineta steineri]
MVDLYSKSMIFQSYIDILVQKLVDQFKIIEKEYQGEPSRGFCILELNAGTVALTLVILKKLFEQTSIIQESRLIYISTDVSGKFLLDAKKCFSSIYLCIQYELSNLDEDLATQKLNLYSFDFLHVAQDLMLCLNRVQQLLQSNDFLLYFRLKTDTTGQLQTLKYRLFDLLSSLSPNDVEVEICAFSLNFKDLMLALGMLENPMGFDRQILKYRENSINLSLELSGIMANVEKTYRCKLFANSHSTEEWKLEVMKLTNGEGVDNVLNPLKGDAIQADVQCLKIGGLFIEIGKVDILNHS